jgi:hypothetical protein
MATEWRCGVMPGCQRLDAAVVVLHMVGGGAVINLDHPKKWSVTVAVTVTVCPSDNCESTDRPGAGHVPARSLSRSRSSNICHSIPIVVFGSVCSTVTIMQNFMRFFKIERTQLEVRETSGMG